MFWSLLLWIRIPCVTSAILQNDLTRAKNSRTEKNISWKIRLERSSSPKNPSLQLVKGPSLILNAFIRDKRTVGDIRIDEKKNNVQKKIYKKGNCWWNERLIKIREKNMTSIINILNFFSIWLHIKLFPELFFASPKRENN